MHKLKAVFHFNRIVAKRSVFYGRPYHETMKYAMFCNGMVEVEYGLIVMFILTGLPENSNLKLCSRTLQIVNELRFFRL